MVSTPSVHIHAIERLMERFGVEKSWLLNELEQGRFVWLKGNGDSRDAKSVRSGHLIYNSHKNEYCIVVMDDRSRLAVTVLTEEMAIKSPWSKGLDRAAKLRAKRIALGEDAINDINFFLLYAEDRGELSVTLQLKTFLYSWNPVVLSIYKTNIKPEQIDILNKCCTLSEEQINEASRIIIGKIAAKEMRPYGKFYLKTGSGKFAVISNKSDFISDLENAEGASRWFI